MPYINVFQCWNNFQNSIHLDIVLKRPFSLPPRLAKLPLILSPHPLYPGEILKLLPKPITLAIYGMIILRRDQKFLVCSVVCLHTLFLNITQRTNIPDLKLVQGGSYWMPSILSRIKSLCVKFHLQRCGSSTIPYRKHVDSTGEYFLRLRDNLWGSDHEVTPVA